MTVFNLATVVLRGVGVACDVGTGLVRMGSNAAGRGASAVNLSAKRHLSSRIAHTDPDQYPTEGEPAPAGRAGRPAVRAGVLDSRSPAPQAGTPSATLLTTRWCQTPLASGPARLKRNDRGDHPRHLRRHPDAQTGKRQRLLAMHPGQGAREMPTGFTPVLGVVKATLRGA